MMASSELFDDRRQIGTGLFGLPLGGDASVPRPRCGLAHRRRGRGRRVGRVQACVRVHGQATARLVDVIRCKACTSDSAWTDRSGTCARSHNWASIATFRWSRSAHLYWAGRIATRSPGQKCPCWLGVGLAEGPWQLAVADDYSNNTSQAGLFGVSGETAADEEQGLGPRLRSVRSTRGRTA